MTEELLKPCPFCGSSDVDVRETIADALVACNICSCRTGFVYLVDNEASNAARIRGAIAAWNTRALQNRGVEE